MPRFIIILLCFLLSMVISINANLRLCGTQFDRRVETICGFQVPSTGIPRRNTYCEGQLINKCCGETCSSDEINQCCDEYKASLTELSSIQPGCNNSSFPPSSSGNYAAFSIFAIEFSFVYLVSLAFLLSL